MELIKAIMMQESGGRGLDPMQCSEGSFNTKYPKQPNGITDPEYSISCGVQEIKTLSGTCRGKKFLWIWKILNWHCKVTTMEMDIWNGRKPEVDIPLQMQQNFLI